MSRHARSWFGVFAPIYLLALGSVADRMLHHAPPLTPRPVPAQPAPAVRAIVATDAPVASAHPRTALEVLHKIRQSCPNPERADGCSPATLGAALADDLPVVRALPVLREALFMLESPTDWNLADPSEPATFYADQQFPRHLARMNAIESIEGLPIRRAFKLTRAEHRQLSPVATTCHHDTSAQWLLYKLAGAPLPTFSQIRAHRAACDAARRKARI